MPLPHHTAAEGALLGGIAPPAPDAAVRTNEVAAPGTILQMQVCAHACEQLIERLCTLLFTAHLVSL